MPLDPTTFAQHKVVLSETVTLVADTPSYVLVNHDGAISGANSATVLGATLRAGRAGEQTEVVTLGIVPLRVAANADPIPEGALVQAGANGTVQISGAGSNAVARARTATTALTDQETGSPELFVIAAVGFNLGNTIPVAP